MPLCNACSWCCQTCGEKSCCALCIQSCYRKSWFVNDLKYSTPNISLMAWLNRLMHFRPFDSTLCRDLSICISSAVLLMYICLDHWKPMRMNKYLHIWNCQRNALFPWRIVEEIMRVATTWRTYLSIILQGWRFVPLTNNETRLFSKFYHTRCWTDSGQHCPHWRNYRRVWFNNFKV